MRLLPNKCKYLLVFSVLISSFSCEAHAFRFLPWMYRDKSTEVAKDLSPKIFNPLPKSATILSPEGLNLIKTFEGFRAHVYNDIGGKPTIGYGHLLLPSEKYIMISEAEASILLRHDLMTAENCVRSRLGSEYVTQGEYDAMVSLTYNWGCGNFARSTILKLMLQDKDEEAEKMLLKVDRVNGKISKGLERRRLAEEALFDNQSQFFHPNRKVEINKPEEK